MSSKSHPPSGSFREHIDQLIARFAKEHAPVRRKSDDEAESAASDNPVDIHQGLFERSWRGERKR